MLRVPFFLEPDYPESLPYVETNRERLIKKWGGVEGWERQKRNHDLKGRGLDAGISHFNLDRLASNTMASHRLVQHVGKKYGLRVNEALYDELNSYYFVDGYALNDKPRLAKLASKCLEQNVNIQVSGENHQLELMTEEQILDFLKGNEGRKEIDHTLKALHKMGIHSIPKFIVEGNTIVDGAANSDVFIKVFREIEERGEVVAGPIFGHILGISEDMVNIPSHTKRHETRSNSLESQS